MKINTIIVYDVSLMINIKKVTLKWFGLVERMNVKGV